MVQRVTRIVDDDYCYLFPPVEAPSRFVAYFYEATISTTITGCC